MEGIDSEIENMKKYREQQALDKNLPEKIHEALDIISDEYWDNDGHQMREQVFGDLLVTRRKVVGPVSGYFNKYSVSVGNKVVYSHQIGMKEIREAGGRVWDYPDRFEVYSPGEWEKKLDKMHSIAVGFRDKKIAEKEAAELEAKQKELDKTKEELGF